MGKFFDRALPIVLAVISLISLWRIPDDTFFIKAMLLAIFVLLVVIISLLIKILNKDNKHD